MALSTERHEHDPSNGYEAAADAFMAGRGTSSVGVGTVRSWAQSLPRGSAVLDLGCGDGMPISQALLDAGLAVWGVDASFQDGSGVSRSLSEVPCRLRAS